MRVRLAVFAVVVGALVAVPAAGAIAQPEVIRLIEVEQSSTGLDTPGLFEQVPPKAGDRFAFRSALYRWDGRQRGARVGRLQGICTFTQVSLRRFRATAYCVAESTLPGGRIALAGFVTFTEASEAFVIPVVGGTGRFDNAKGSVTIRDLPSGASAHVYNLTP